MESDSECAPCSPPAPGRRTLGVPNAGNTCFIAAWLQAVRPTGAYELACRPLGEDGGGADGASDAMVGALCRLVLRGQGEDSPSSTSSSSSKAGDVEALAGALALAEPAFPVGVQADARAFGMLATSRLQRWSRERHERHRHAAPSRFAPSDPISERLRLRLRHTTRCAACGWSREEDVDAWDLPVPVPPSRRRLDLGVLVAEALVPQADAPAACCASPARERRVSIVRHPRYLLVHLLRFDESARKLYTPVGASARGVTIAGERYDTVATVVHSGSESAGHYTANVRQADGSWRCADDDSVRRVSHRQAFEGGEVYIVVLRRRCCAR